MENKVAIQMNEQFAEIISMSQHTRNEVVRLANASLIDLYWRIGKYISDKIAAAEWGDGVVKQLAHYIEKNNPDVKGFSNIHDWKQKILKLKTYREIINALQELRENV